MATEQTAMLICILRVPDEVQFKKAIELFERNSIKVQSTELVHSRNNSKTYKLSMEMDASQSNSSMLQLEDKFLQFTSGDYYPVPKSPTIEACSKFLVESCETPWFPVNLWEFDVCSKKVLLYGPDSKFDYPGSASEDYLRRRYLLGQIAMEYHHNNPLPNIEYTKEETDTWKDISTGLTEVYPHLACKQFNKNFNTMRKFDRYGTDVIPQLADLNKFIKAQTNFSLRPVAGYLIPRDFLYGLAFRIFPCTQYIRIRKNVDYTPEPDCCHELLGHVPMLIDNDFVNLHHKIGLASIGASEEDIDKLAKLYFFTLEFGLCMEDEQVKVIGAGLLSSLKELKHSIKRKDLHKPLVLEYVFNAECMITTFQNQYFVAESFDSMTRIISEYCDSISKPFDVVYDDKTGSIEIINCSSCDMKLLRDVESDIAIFFELLKDTNKVQQH